MSVQTYGGGQARTPGSPAVEGVILCTSTTHPANPYVGMRIYETDTGMDLIFVGATDGFQMNWGMGWGIVATPVTVAGNSTAFAGETRDAVLGNYVFTALANRNYRIVYENVGVQPGTAGDLIGIRIRDGGASTPTTSSTMLVSAQKKYSGAAGGAGQEHTACNRVVGTLSAGTHTLGAFGIIVAGGASTAVAFNLNTGRALYVEDVGPSGAPS